MALTEDDLRDRLRQAIAASGLTQKAWAEAHDVTPSAVSEFLSGARTTPGPSLLRAIGVRRKGYEYEIISF